MKEALLEVNDPALPPKECWRLWAEMSEERRLGDVHAPDDRPPFRAKAHSFFCQGVQICFLSRGTKSSTKAFAETVVKSAEDLAQAPYELRVANKSDVLIEQGSERFLLKQGQVIFLNKHPAIKISVPYGEYSLTAIQISKELAEDKLSDVLRAPSQIVSPKRPCGEALRKTLAVLSPTALQSLPVSAVAVSESLCSLLSLNLQGTCAKDSLSPTLTEELKRYLRKNFADPKLSPDTASQVLGVSRRTIYNALYREGGSFFDLLFALRIRHAKKLLENEWLRGKLISEIAYQSGFSNTRHFSAVFKKIVGMPPEAYRSMYGKGFE